MRRPRSSPSWGCSPPRARRQRRAPRRPRSAMPGKYFDPARSTVVAGDVVVFRNNDLVTHDVRIAGGVFDSGPIVHFSSWSQQIDTPGGYPFICTLHPFMTGNLDVLAATLAAAPDSVLAGEPLALSGRAPAGTAEVGVEQSVVRRRVDRGRRRRPRRRTGTSRRRSPAVEGASYRVVTPAGASPPVAPRVQASVDVHVDGRARPQAHHGPRPHDAGDGSGFTATLELYSRWHFRWRPQRRVKLDAGGRARVPAAGLAPDVRRVALSRGRRAPALVRSGVVALRTGRSAMDPDTIVPPGGGHGGHGDERQQRPCRAPRLSVSPAARCARARWRACDRGRAPSCGAAPRRGRGPRSRTAAGRCGSARSRRWSPRRSGAR